MRKRLDETNEALQAVLDALVAEDVDITLREIARRHPQLKHASDFTRSTRRMELVEAAMKRQEDARQVKLGPHLKIAATKTELLAAQKADLQALEAQVKALVVACSACIRAVWQHGGASALERYWIDYKGIAESIRQLDAMPAGGQVIDLPRRE